jgi:hypothetical protein
VSRLPRPHPSEYAAYYRRYVDRVPDGGIIETLERQMEESRSLLASVPPEKERFRYAPGKWSIREVVGHVTDTEWVMLYRALSMARGDAAALPGMDQEVWAKNSIAHERSLDELVAGWSAVRMAGVHLLRSLDAGAGARKGSASGKRFTVRTFPWIIAGHELHHMERLREDYLERDA